MLSTLAIAGYRSLRGVRTALGPLNVVIGANDSEKSSLYRALRLFAEMAQGRVVCSRAAEDDREERRCCDLRTIRAQGAVTRMNAA